MTKLDPIIAVTDVLKSSEWYQTIFGFKSMHGGTEFEILIDKNKNVMLCLHKWGEHDHPTMQTKTKMDGNGLILYFRTDRMEQIRKKVIQLGYVIEREIEVNPNSRQKEFSLRDPDGYYITVSDFHRYEG